MKLLLDAGNSALKWATLDADRIGQRGSSGYHDTIPPAWPQLGDLDAIALSSVTTAARTDSMIKWCRQLWPQCPLSIISSPAQGCGVSNAYPQPERLGSDRWAALIGAHRHYSGDKCIVDAGTALTIDLLHANGQHLGGFIVPGNHSMISALQTNTTLAAPTAAALPPLAPGTNTADCIRQGASGALAALIERVQHQLGGSNGRLIISGGGAAHLLPWLPADTLHQPDLVFHGLAHILETTQ